MLTQAPTLALHAVIYKIVQYKGVYVIIKQKVSINIQDITGFSTTQFSLPSMRIKRTANGPIDHLTNEVSELLWPSLSMIKMPLYLGTKDDMLYAPTERRVQGIACDSGTSYSLF